MNKTKGLFKVLFNASLIGVAGFGLFETVRSLLTAHSVLWILHYTADGLLLSFVFLLAIDRFLMAVVTYPIRKT